MTPSPIPSVSRGSRFPLVWLVPVLAVLVAGWMLFSHYRDHGPEIIIEFADGTGVEEGKTSLDYKGIKVGFVHAVMLKPDLSGVLVHARLHRNAEALATKGAQFWIVQPEIGFGGVRGLDTLLTGARINVLPGHGPAVHHFKGLARAPLPLGATGSRTFLLESDKLGSLNPGSPVFYRQVKVGVVESSRLSDDSGSVLTRIRIDAPYVDLVRNNTRFWNAGGFDFKMSLFGAQMKNTSLESLINGGIAFATPDSNPLAPAANEGTLFQLTREAEKEWFEWRPRIPIQPEETLPKDRSTSGIAPLLQSAENEPAK